MSMMSLNLAFFQNENPDFYNGEQGNQKPASHPDLK